MPVLRGHGSLTGPLPEPPGPWDKPAGPKTVEHFREMLGICAHAQWVNEPSTVYDPLSDWQTVIDLAVECGMSWHRTEQSVGQAYMRDGLAAKHAYTVSKGMKLSFIINGYWDGAEEWYGSPDAQLDFIQAHYPLASIAAFESVNEPDLFHSENGNWPAELVDHMVRVQRAVRSRPELDSIPILGPGLCFNTAYPLGQTFAAKGVDPRNVMDLYTPHPYDGGDMPKLAHYEDERTKYLPLGRGDGPPWITEWGYYTSLQTTDYAPVDEKTQAIYLMKGWATQFLYGCRHSSMYAFVDTATSTTNSENNFGMVRSDYSRKSSHVAMKNLVTFLGPKAPPIVATTKPYTATGPSDLRHFQVQRADGTFVVFVWRETLVWNRDTRVPVTVAPQALTVSGATVAYNPRTGQNVPLGSIDGDLLLVEL